MLASDSRIGFFVLFFFYIEYYYRHYFVLAFAIQLNIFWNSIIFKEKKVSFFTIIKCYSNRCVQNADCRLQTAHRRCWTVVPRPINISALMMRIKRNFSRSC